jgi:hypothetical protein
LCLVYDYSFVYPVVYLPCFFFKVESLHKNSLDFLKQLLSKAEYKDFENLDIFSIIQDPPLILCCDENKCEMEKKRMEKGEDIEVDEEVYFFFFFFIFGFGDVKKIKKLIN